MLIIALLFLSAVSFCHADPPTVLTAATYHSFVNTSARGIVIVAFCNHDSTDCRRFDSFLLEIEHRYKDRSDIRIGTVDVRAEWALADTVGVRGLPGLIIKNYNRITNYKGDVTIQTMFTSLDKVVQPRTLLLETAAEMNEHVEKKVKRMYENVAPVVMFTSTEDTASFNAFVEVAHNDNYALVFNFAATHQAPLLSRGDGKPVLDGTVALYRPEGFEPRVVYGIAKTQNELKTFLSRSLAKPFEQVTHSTNHRIHLRNRSIVYFFFDPSASETNAPIMEVATALAVRYEATTSFAWYTMDSCGRLPMDMGLSGGTFPCVGMQNGITTQEYYPYAESLPLTVEGIAAFVDSVTSRAVQRFMHSEPIPETPLDPVDGFVKAVGWTVEDLVLNSPKRFVVLMTVTDHYCPLCNHTMESLEKVRRRIASPDDVAFVKIDPSLNDMPHDLVHEVLFPGFLVRDNVKKTITIAKGRKASVAALEDFFSTFFEVLPQSEEEKSATIELNPHEHDCFSKQQHHDFQQRLNVLTELKNSLGAKFYEEGRVKSMDEL